MDLGNDIQWLLKGFKRCERWGDAPRAMYAGLWDKPIGPTRLNIFNRPRRPHQDEIITIVEAEDTWIDFATLCDVGGKERLHTLLHFAAGPGGVIVLDQHLGTRAQLSADKTRLVSASRRHDNWQAIRILNYAVFICEARLALSAVA